MSLTVPRVNTWLRATLTGDATLLALGAPPLSTGTRVYRRRIPQAVTDFPCLVFQHQGGSVLRVVGTYRVWSNLVYLIKLVYTPEDTAATVESIQNRVEVLLDSVSGTTTNGTIHACLHEAEMPEYDEVTPGGQIFLHSGVMYRFLATSTA